MTVSDAAQTPGDSRQVATQEQVQNYSNQAVVFCSATGPHFGKANVFDTATMQMLAKKKRVEAFSGNEEV